MKVTAIKKNGDVIVEIFVQNKKSLNYTLDIVSDRVFSAAEDLDFPDLYTEWINDGRLMLVRGGTV